MAALREWTVVLVGYMSILTPGWWCLQCYNCENEQSNYRCLSEVNLVQCEEGMDTCQTTISYSDVSQKLSIIKTCTKNASCGLQVNATRVLQPCDHALSSWVCTTCCFQDGCNRGGATSTRDQHHVTPASLVLLTIITIVIIDSIDL